jgi:hypothetical protein
MTVGAVSQEEQLAHPLVLSYTPQRATRPGYGQSGRGIRVKANWFKVSLLGLHDCTGGHGQAVPALQMHACAHLPPKYEQRLAPGLTRRS